MINDNRPLSRGRRFGPLVPSLLLVIAAAASCRQTAGPGLRLNEAEFRDKVHACWLGKAIGGTLGMPFEGVTTPIKISRYMHLQPGRPAANDDLDLQLLWLKALEENDARVDAVTLAGYWDRYIGVDWNEYGIAVGNIRRGVLPPLSGLVGNPKWKDSNGAWIRTEIWALLNAGRPFEAAAMAREDACVDHGDGEGTAAAEFVAALESTAFIEKDHERLVGFALNAVPSGSQISAAVRAVLGAWKAGRTPEEARMAAVAATDPGILTWYPAPANVAYVVLGLLYGRGDFGGSLLLAVNCGDDTDCTGATLGSILGILGGMKAIPASWREPIGESIVTEAVRGFRPPADLSELTERTVALAGKLAARSGGALALSSGPTDASASALLLRRAAGRFPELWSIPPFMVRMRAGTLDVGLDYGRLPLVRDGEPFPLVLEIENRGGERTVLDLGFNGLPAGTAVEGLAGSRIILGPGESVSRRLTLISQGWPSGCSEMRIKDVGGSLSVPVSLVKDRTPAPEAAFSDDLIAPGRSSRMTMRCSDPRAVIRYTLDGREPDGSSAAYSGPFEISATTLVRARAFSPGAVPSDEVRSLVESGDFSGHGLAYHVFDGDYYSDLGFIDEFFAGHDRMIPSSRGVSPGPRDLERLLAGKYDFRAVVWDGWLEIGVGGPYTFFLQGYTRCRLTIDGNELNSSGREVSRMVRIGRGRHAVRLEYAHYYHNARLSVDVSGPGLARRPLPVAWLRPGR